MSNGPAPARRSSFARFLFALAGLLAAALLYHRWNPTPSSDREQPSSAPAQAPPLTDRPVEVKNPNLLDVALHPDGDTVIAVGTEGSLFRSDDGGAQVARVSIPTREALVRLLVERQRGTILAIGSAGTILRSSDRGRSFAHVASGTGHNLNAIAQAVNGTIVVVGDQGVALSSTDDGEHFTLEDTHRPHLLNELVALPTLPGAFAAAGELGSVVLRDASGRWIPVDAPSRTFVTALTGTADGALLAGLADGLVVASTDNGAHWQEVFGSRDQNYVMGFAPSSDGTLLLARLRNRALARSQDQGRSFSLLDIPAARVPTALDWLEGSGFVGVADDGGVVRSDLAGKAWTHTPPVESMRTNKLAVNPKTGSVVAVGPSGFIGRLAPGAVRFDVISADLGGLIRALVQAPSTDTIVGVGLHATIVRSTNGGKTFQRVHTTLTPTVELRALSYDATHSVFVAATTTGTVYRSSDDGSSFHKSAELGTEVLQLAWLGEGRILALCSKNGARLTHDGGKTFSTPLLGLAETFRHATPGCSPGSVLVVGDKGTLLRSTGGTFERVASPVQTTLRHVACQPQTQHTWVVGDNGTLLRSDDASAPFRPVPLPTEENLFTLGFSDDGAVLFLGGNAGILLRSTDRGHSFTPVPTGSPQTVRITHFVPEIGEFVIAGVGGLLMLTTQRTVPQRLVGRFEGRFDHVLTHAGTKSIIVAGDRLLCLPTP